MKITGIFFKGRFKYGVNTVLLILMVLAIIVLVEILLTRHHLRFDLTETKRYSLAEKTRKILKNLDKEVKTIAFYGVGEFGRAQIEELLEEYTYHSQKFSYEFVDPARNPGKTKEYEVKSHGTIIMESGSRRERTFRRDEESITNTLFKVIREEKKIVYFLKGHGEGDISRDYSEAKKAIEEENYQAKELVLLREKDVPSDASVLVINGPKKDLFESELESISRFIQQGGKILFMIDPFAAPALTSFLRQYGIELREDMIIDKLSRVFGGDYLMPIVSSYESHPITEDLSLASFFPLARSIEIAEKPGEGIEVQTLAKTGQGSWGEVNKESLKEGKVGYTEGEDAIGPLTVAAVASVATRDKKSKARIVVYGDSDFARDTHLNLSGNKNLFLNTIGWLAEEESLISIRPREAHFTPIILTKSQARLSFWLPVVLLPAIVLGIGAGILSYRRWRG